MLHSRVVRVEVLVHIEDQVGVTSVRVRNGGKRGCGATGDKGLGRGVIVTGKEDHLCGGTSLSNCRNGSLGSILTHLYEQ